MIEYYNILQLSSGKLKNFIKQTAFAAGLNETRLVLTGVCLETKQKDLQMIATDSYRLAKKISTNDEDYPKTKVIIPSKSIEELSKILEDEKIFDLAELFKVFGDTTRVKILCALYESEMCVCDLSILLNVTQSAISHQLRVLKSARLVKFRRSGKIVYYSLDDEHVMHIFDEGLKHIIE